VPYLSPYTLPIPTTTQPTFSGRVPSISFPDAKSSALFTLAGGAIENFGLRFTGYITVPATADYTFSMDNDDGAMLFIDGHSLVNHTGKHGFNGYVPGTMPLVAGLHTIEIDYFQAGGNAGISLKVAYLQHAAVGVPATWLSFSVPPAPPPSPPPRSPPPHPPPPSTLLPGLSVQSYVPYGSPYTLPIPSAQQPNFTGSAANISFPDTSHSALFALAGGATSLFGLRFTGYVTVPLATDYTFSMDNDDGAMLFIDGHSLVNHAGALNTP
jgi:hypothetical protein